MSDLQKYVDGLFRHQHFNAGGTRPKERNIKQYDCQTGRTDCTGIAHRECNKKAKESLSDIDCLIDGNQLTDVGSYYLECSQTLLLNCIVLWIFTLPLLLTVYARFSYTGLVLVILSGCSYIFQKDEK